MLARAVLAGCRWRRVLSLLCLAILPMAWGIAVTRSDDAQAAARSRCNMTAVYGNVSSCTISWFNRTVIASGKVTDKGGVGRDGRGGAATQVVFRFYVDGKVIDDQTRTVKGTREESRTRPFRFSVTQRGIDGVDVFLCYGSGQNRKCTNRDNNLRDP
jgi:hypothetical protein